MLFGNTTSGGEFNDAANATQLFRYLSDTAVAAGDDACNTGIRP